MAGVGRDNACRCWVLHRRVLLGEVEEGMNGSRCALGTTERASKQACEGGATARDERRKQRAAPHVPPPMPERARGGVRSEGGRRVR